MFNTGQVDETFRIVSPAKAELLDGFLDFTRMVDDAVEQGVDLTSFEIESFFGWLRQNFQAIAAEFSVDNSDNVANSFAFTDPSIIIIPYILGRRKTLLLNI